MERAYAEVVATEGKGEEVKEEVKDKEEKKE